MLNFKITNHRSQPRYINLLGSVGPVMMLPGRHVSTVVEFDYGIKFLVADNIWWYQPEMPFTFVDGDPWMFDIFEENIPYTIDQILDDAPEVLTDTIIFNIDIFRRIE